MRKAIVSSLVIALFLVAVHPVVAQQAETRGVENKSYSGLAYIFTGIIGQYLSMSISYTDTEATLLFDDGPPLHGEYQQSSLGFLTLWTANFSLPGTPPIVLGGLRLLGINTFLSVGTFGAFFLGLAFQTA